MERAELSEQEAKQALSDGHALEYRRTPHTDWMRCPHGHEFNQHFYYRRAIPRPMMEISISLKVPDDSTSKYIHGAFCFAAVEVMRKINRDGHPKVDDQYDVPMPHGDSATFFRSE